MADTTQSQQKEKEKEIKLPMIVQNKKQKRRLAFHVEGTISDFADGKATVKFENIGKLFAPELKKDKLERVIPIKIGFCMIKHNLPVSLIPDAEMASTAVTGVDSTGNYTDYQAVLPPNCQLQKLQLLHYADNIDESMLRIAGTTSTEELEKQVVQLPSEKMKSVCLVSPWLNNVILENKHMLEVDTGVRIGDSHLFNVNDTAMYPIDKKAAMRMLELLMANIKSVPFKSIGPSLQLKFMPYGYASWNDLLQKWQGTSSTAADAFANMPFYISGTIKYVYAVLD